MNYQDLYKLKNKPEYKYLDKTVINEINKVFSGSNIKTKKYPLWRLDIFFSQVRCILRERHDRTYTPRRSLSLSRHDRRVLAGKTLEGNVSLRPHIVGQC